MLMAADEYVGRIVLSLAGKDRGRLFVVTQSCSDGLYAYLADGRLRRVGKPKKKKLRHLKLCGPPETVSARSGALTDSGVRKLLKEAYAADMPGMSVDYHSTIKRPITGRGDCSAKRRCD